MALDSTYQHLNERELIQLLSRNDQSALAEFMLRYYGKLFPVILGITKNYGAAEELVQDVFLKIWDKRAELSDITALNAWLFRVASNASLNWLKRANLEGRIINSIGISSPPFSTITQEHVDLNEAKKQLQILVDQLPPQQQQVFNMVHHQGMSYDEVGQQLGISSATARSHWTRAIQTLRAALRMSGNFMMAILLFL